MVAPSTNVFKTGRVVIVLSGRFAGKKGVVVTAYDQGNRAHPFGHALVVGLEKTPKKVDKSMPAEVVDKRTEVKVFLKHFNYRHLMPTRYVIDQLTDVKCLLAERKISKLAEKKVARADIAKIIKQRLLNSTDPKMVKDFAFLRAPLKF